MISWFRSFLSSNNGIVGYVDALAVSAGGGRYREKRKTKSPLFFLSDSLTSEGEKILNFCRMQDHPMHIKRKMRTVEIRIQKCNVGGVTSKIHAQTRNGCLVQKGKILSIQMGYHLFFGERSEVVDIQALGLQGWPRVRGDQPTVQCRGNG